MTELTKEQEEDAIDALSDIRRVIMHLEHGESTLEEVARVLVDTRQYIDPLYKLLTARKPQGREEGEPEPGRIRSGS
jgi:hypothetical protein